MVAESFTKGTDMSQDLFYDRKKTVRTTHTMKVNSGGNLCIRQQGEIRIDFIDGKFDQVIWQSAETLSDRNYWRVVGAINAEIERIEQQFAAPQATAA